MKTRHLLGLAALSALMLAGCGDKEDKYFDVTGINDTVTFSSEAGQTLSFEVSASKAWVVSKKNLDWLRVSPLSGNSGEKKTVTVTTTENKGDDREGTLTVTAGTESVVVTVKQTAKPFVPSFESSHDASKAITFASKSTEAYTFSVETNVDWSVSVPDGAFVEVLPAEGLANRKATISVTPTINYGDKRTCTFTITPDQMDAITYSVEQEAFDSFFSVDGATDGVIAFSNASGTATISVTADKSWSISKTGLDWITLSAEGGDGDVNGTAATVTLTADKNTGDAREGTITVTPTAAGFSAVTIKVTQAEADKPTEPVLMAEWTLGDGALLTNNHSEIASASTTTNKTTADTPAGTTATMELVIADSSISKGQLYASADGAGHYAVKAVWTDDCILFTVPLTGTIPAGATINFKTGMSPNSSPFLWMVEYLDGDGQWKPTSLNYYESKTLTEEDGTTPLKVPYSVNLGDTGTPTSDINETGTLSSAVSDVLKLRMRCSDGRLTCSKTGEAAKTKTTTGAQRLRPYNNAEDLSAIQIWVKY